MRRSRKTPEICRAHFVKRWRERIGGTAPIDAINDAIRSGQSVPVYSESLSRVHYAINWGGEPVTVVYNKNLNTVVTVLPRR